MMSAIWKGTEIISAWVPWKRRCWCGREPGSIRKRQAQTSFLDRGECLSFLAVSCSSHFYCPHGTLDLGGHLNTSLDLGYLVEWKEWWMAAWALRVELTFCHWSTGEDLVQLVSQSCNQGVCLDEL